VALVIQYTAPALVVGWTSLASRRAPAPSVLAALVTALVGVVLVVDVASGALGRTDDKRSAKLTLEVMLRRDGLSAPLYVRNPPAH